MLLTQKLTGSDAVVTQQSKRKGLVFDVSGSMYSSLKLMKEHMKEKLLNMFSEDDLVTLIAYSGRNQCTVLLKDFPIAKTKDLSVVYKAIDGLQTIGLTSFLEPLDEVFKSFVKDSSEADKKTTSIYFLTDGWDNQNSENDLLRYAEQLKEVSMNFVEYGNYCNTKLLLKLANKSQGNVIFSEDFDAYTEEVEKFVSSNSDAHKVTIENVASSDIYWYFLNGEIYTFKANVGDVVSIHKNVSEIYSLVFPENYSLLTQDNFQGAYAFYYHKDKDFIHLIKEDLYVLNLIENAIAKQDQKKLLAELKELAEGKKQAGYWGNLSEHSTTSKHIVQKMAAIDVLEYLASVDEEVLLDIDHEEFDYNVVSRKKHKLTKEEKLASVQQSAATVSSEEFIEKVTNALGHVDHHFVADKVNGYPIRGLVLNEDRPSISLGIYKNGVVELSDNQFFKNFRSVVFRNLTIIKDGILNVRKLPIWSSMDVVKHLSENGIQVKTILKRDEKNRVFSIVYLDKVILRNSIRSSKDDLKEIVDATIDMEKLSAYAKVYKSVIEERFGKAVSEGWKEKYTQEQIDFLKSVGITERGYSPQMKSSAVSDVYVGTELRVKIAGMSALPSVDDVRKKMASGKSLTTSQFYMAEALNAIESYEDRSESHLRSCLATIETAIKDMRKVIARIKFNMVMAKSAMLDYIEDEYSFVKNFADKDVDVTVVFKDVDVKI